MKSPLFVLAVTLGIVACLFGVVALFLNVYTMGYRKGQASVAPSFHYSRTP